MHENMKMNDCQCGVRRLPDLGLREMEPSPSFRLATSYPLFCMGFRGQHAEKRMMMMMMMMLLLLLA